MAVEKYPEYREMYLELVLVDPFCPVIYWQEPLVFHGWLDDSGGCFTSSFLLSDAELCMFDPLVVDVAFVHFDATLCVEQLGETWCTDGGVNLALA